VINIDIIAGARPNFVKIAPIIDAIKKAKNNGSKIEYRLIHTGQHYDRMMSEEFFKQLQIPEPDINLDVGSGTQAEQTANIMIRYENVIKKNKCDLCLVVGDVNSTMACAIVAKKSGIPVAHVEGGIRSFDWTMPEEINRVVTDSITNWFFTTSVTANQNLIKNGIDVDRIIFVGNTMIDTLIKQKKYLRKPKIWDEYGLKTNKYLVLTLHRPSNVDEKEQINIILHAINKGAGGMPIIFPVHPRTKKIINKQKNENHGLVYIEPQGYLEFNYLVKHAKGVITDSGGITEETTVLGVPCLTLRENTERPETVKIGTNELIGTNPKKIEHALKKLLAGKWKKGTIPEKWDGMAAERIIKKILEIYDDTIAI
jgi:UDP-N-acetylglucosamine 2-epimerase (non-hydrolysing)